MKLIHLLAQGNRLANYHNIINHEWHVNLKTVILMLQLLSRSKASTVTEIVYYINKSGTL